MITVAFSIENTEHEEFFSIPNFSNYYISKKGNIYHSSKKKLMNQNILNGTGYKAVNIKNDDGKYQTKKIHRLLMEIFVPNPLNKKCINHIDGNKLNNDLSNLEWASHSDNLYHAWHTGLRSKSGLVNTTYKICGSDNNISNLEFTCR